MAESFKVPIRRPMDYPLPQHTPVMVRVLVRDLDDPDVLIHDRTDDHNNRFFREWMAKTSWWALRNNKSMIVYPLPLKETINGNV